MRPGGLRRDVSDAGRAVRSTMSVMTLQTSPCTPTWNGGATQVLANRQIPARLRSPWIRVGMLAAAPEDDHRTAMAGFTQTQAAALKDRLVAHADAEGT